MFRFHIDVDAVTRVRFLVDAKTEEEARAMVQRHVVDNTPMSVRTLSERGVVIEDGDRKSIASVNKIYEITDV